MLRNFLLSVFLFFVTLFALALPGTSFATGLNKPLMIIRFDNNAVDYEKNLDTAVKMAIAKKPTAFFDLVAISPETKNTSTNKQFSEDAKFIVNKITDQIKEAGVAPNMVRSVFQQSKLTKNNEIQIFVQ